MAVCIILLSENMMTVHYNSFIKLFQVEQHGAINIGSIHYYNGAGVGGGGILTLTLFPGHAVFILVLFFNRMQTWDGLGTRLHM